MDADDLATPEARSSSAIILAKFVWNNPGSER